MDTDLSHLLPQLSDAIADRAAAVAPLLAAIHGPRDRVLTGTLWRADTVVTSEQALHAADGYALELADGSRREATLAGRDPTTNTAVLRLAEPAAAPALPEPAAVPRLGALVLAFGAGPQSGPSVRFTSVREAGCAWTSQSGGRIAARIVLDMRASRAEEGGPVIDAHGHLVGMACAGPRGRALVIPHATLAPAVDALLAHGRVVRGWLGVGLQPVLVPESLRTPTGQCAGLMVVSLAPGGPAERGGVLPGDILLALGDVALTQSRSIRAALTPDRVGSTLPLRLLRAGAVTTCDVVIIARPEAE